MDRNRNQPGAAIVERLLWSAQQQSSSLREEHRSSGKSATLLLELTTSPVVSLIATCRPVKTWL